MKNRKIIYFIVLIQFISLKCLAQEWISNKITETLKDENVTQVFYFKNYYYGFTKGNDKKKLSSDRFFRLNDSTYEEYYFMDDSKNEISNYLTKRRNYVFINNIIPTKNKIWMVSINDYNEFKYYIFRIENDSIFTYVFESPIGWKENKYYERKILYYTADSEDNLILITNEITRKSEKGKKIEESKSIIKFNNYGKISETKLPERISANYIKYFFEKDNIKTFYINDENDNDFALIYDKNDSLIFEFSPASTRYNYRGNNKRFRTVNSFSLIPYQNIYGEENIDYNFWMLAKSRNYNDTLTKEVWLYKINSDYKIDSMEILVDYKFMDTKSKVIDDFNFFVYKDLLLIFNYNGIVFYNLKENNYKIISDTNMGDSKIRIEGGDPYLRRCYLIGNYLMGVYCFTNTTNDFAFVFPGVFMLNLNYKN